MRIERMSREEFAEIEDAVYKNSKSAFDALTALTALMYSIYGRARPDLSIEEVKPNLMVLLDKAFFTLETASKERSHAEPN